MKQNPARKKSAMALVGLGAVTALVLSGCTPAEGDEVVTLDFFQFKGSTK